MRILALETSSISGSVAVFEDDRLLGESVFPDQQRSAQAFAPAIAKQLDEVGWQPHEIQLIAVTRGPGSFTGLRVGVTAAKVLAYAAGADVIGVNTLEAIAWQTPGAVDDVRVVMDAQRKQVFAAGFRRRPDGKLSWQSIQPTAIVDNQRWLQSLGDDCAVTGPALARLAKLVPDGVPMVDEACWAPKASTVGLVAYRSYLSGQRDDLWQLSPDYYRKSAAEEKRDREQGHQ